MNGLFRFVIISCAILIGTYLALFILGIFLQISLEPVIFLDLFQGVIILVVTIMIYLVYEKILSKTDAGIRRIAVLPYSFDELSVWVGIFSLIGITLVSLGIFTLPVTWNFLLVFTGLEFSIIGWILGVLLDRVPGAMINDLKRNDKPEKDVFPYHLTQFYYYFLYTIIGILLIFTGLVTGISRLPD